MLDRARLVPELLVSNIETSLAFWAGLIGFRVAYDRPKESFAYLDLHGAQLMLEQRDDACRQWLSGSLDHPLGRGINFQIEVVSVEPALNRLAEAKWPLFMACEDTWYRTGATEFGQRQFLVQDPDGYLLRICQALAEHPSRSVT